MNDTMQKLYSVVLDRKANPQEGSYTCYLFDKGLDKILKKVGEECAETIIAAKNGVKEETVGEISDLIYHLMVMMAQQGIPLDDVMAEWHGFVAEEREKELTQIIQEEKLKEPETRKFLENAFRDGEIKTTGTDIDKLMPPVSRFGGGGARAKKKQTVIDKLKRFFERFFGIGEVDFTQEDETESQ